MSATTRSRRGKSKDRNKRKPVASARFPVLFDAAKFDAPDGCDCPACSGADFDPGRMIDELTAELTEFEEPLDAEVAAAMLVSVGASLGGAFEQMLLEGLVPEFESRATTGSLAMLLSIAAVAPGKGGQAASAAAGRLIRAGVAQPGWAAELAEPVTVSGCVRVYDTQGTAAMLACLFDRGDRAHAFLVSVDELDCGAASDILVFPGDQLPEALDTVRADGREAGFEVVTDPLDAAEFRWHVEKALDARAVHDLDQFDADLPVEEYELLGEDDLPGYPGLAALLRARIVTLPAPNRPPAPHSDGDERDLTALQMLPELVGNAPLLANPASLRGTRPLPAKRGKADRPAPVYQIKVGLRGAKPPIWRRLEVPAEISLAQLHEVIQIAFDWDGGHLHVFSTPYGEFGTADAELGHRPEAPVTLEQVAPGPRSKITYTYDFGDDWEHGIVVEKVLEPTGSSGLPRCTGGRRAAPPDDCGGLWGYAELAEILGDPDHPEHEDRLDWLGLNAADDFDPASFDPDAVTSRLGRCR